MKGIILAAGRGSRMGILTEGNPKCMTVLHGKALIDWQADGFRKAGINEIGIVRGYLGDKIARELPFFENYRWKATNMVVSLMSASQWLENDTCIVTYADIVFDIQAIHDLANAKGDIVIMYDVNWLKLWRQRFEDPLSDAETFATDDHGVLVEIGKRAKSIDEIRGQYMGLFKINPAGWNSIKTFLAGLHQEHIDRLDMTGMLRQLIMRGVVVDTVGFHGRWYEIDSESDLKKYEKMGKVSC